MSTRTHAVTYTARETARITGVSEAQQRNFRRHKYLRSTAAGWNRYTPAEVAELFLMKQLSDRGLTPAKAQSLLAGGPSPENIVGRWTGYVTDWAKQYGAIVTDPDGPMRGEFRIPKRPQRFPRFLVVSGDGPKLVNSLAGAFDGTPEMMAAIVLDFKALGQELVERAGPLWYEEEGRD